MVVFRRINRAEFVVRFAEAAERLERKRLPFQAYGEVRVPGRGWHPCVLDAAGRPSAFYRPGEGWFSCPPGTPFSELN